MIGGRATLLLATTATTLSLFGCGGDDGSDETPATASKGNSPSAEVSATGKRIASGADTVSGLCQQKQKQPLTTEQRVELHTAIGSMVVAYDRSPNATVKKGTTAQDALLNLAAGMVNHCDESREAGRLLEAIRPKG